VTRLPPLSTRRRARATVAGVDNRGPAAEPAAAYPDRSAATRRPAIASFVLSLLGAALSAYLAYEHFTGSTTLVCAANSVVDCLKVTTSSWSVIAGVPVSVAGLAFFLGMTVLCLPISAVADMHTVRIGACLVGLAMVLWLLYIELFEVGAICLWCTAVHVVTLLLFGAVWWWRQADRNS